MFGFSWIYMYSDIKAALERDPAATGIPEVALTYPGVHAVLLHRLAHFLWRRGVPFIPRLISQFARHITGVEIHPGAVIGESFFIDHGMGVVIGETAVIGSNVTLFQGVTLGGTGKERGRRHPTLGNDIVVGTGAKILGNITIGDNVNIGANAVVIKDVPSDSTVVGVPGRIAKKTGRPIPGINIDYTNLPDPLAERLGRLQEEIDKMEEELKKWKES